MIVRRIIGFENVYSIFMIRQPCCYLSRELERLLLFATRFQCDQIGDLLHFGQLFKACDENYFVQIAYVLGNFYFFFLVKSFF